MTILKAIKELEKKDEGDCFKCEHFSPINEEGQCDIYDIPNHGVGVCQDWKLSEFWEKKRGYL